MQFEQKIVTKLCEQAQTFFNQKENPSNVFKTSISGKRYTIVKTADGTSDQHFLLRKRLGVGGFGQVFVGLPIDMKKFTIDKTKLMAVKITDFSERGSLSITDREESKKECEHEITCLKLFDSFVSFSFSKRPTENTISTGKIAIKKQVEIEECILSMTLHSGKSMDKHLNSPVYPILSLLDMSYSLADKLSLIHAQGVIHSDLNPKNVLWDDKTRAVNIVDFNRAKLLKAGEIYCFSNLRSAKDWMAPECSTVTKEELKQYGGGYKYSKASDIYSMGLILAAKYGLNSAEASYLRLDKKLIKEFIAKMTQPDEKSRPNIEQCKEFFLGLKMQLARDYNDRAKEKLIDIVDKLSSRP
ncbi:MAG: protein kinase family protein [Proteobacteria bacterium]|nr:protein kinase family protein [Pseudomonadota bacterium]